MGEIIRNWLFRKTGTLLIPQEKDFGMNISDGTILAKLLRSYGVLHADVTKAIKPSDDPTIKVKNLQHLHSTLKLIGIEFSDSEVEDLAFGFGTTALKLIYSIYMKLEGTEKFNLASQIESKPSELQFHLKTDPPPTSFLHPLLKKINEKQAVIELQQNRYENIIRQCKKSRDVAREALKKQTLFTHSQVGDEKLWNERQGTKDKESYVPEKSVKDFSLKFKSNEKDLSYLDLIALKQTMENTSMIKASKSNFKEILNMIKQRSRRQADSQAFRHRMHTLLLEKLWNHLQEQNEKILDEKVLQKLLRQSQFEKQIATKLFQVRYEQKSIAQNRVRGSKLILDRQYTELASDHTKKDVRKKIETYEAYIEKRRQLELHRRLYKSKLKHKFEKHYSLCLEILCSIIDLSIKSSLYQENFGSEVPIKLWNEWKVLFFKGLPIFEGIENLEILLDEEHSCTPDPAVKLAVERNKALMDHDFEDYNSLSGIWSLEVLNNELKMYNDNLEVLGFIVHRLLLTKYPKPMPKKPALLPSAKVAAVVVGFDDSQTISMLQGLLNKRGILVVTHKNVLVESINAYHEEILSKHEFEASIILHLISDMNGRTHFYTGDENTAPQKNNDMSDEEKVLDTTRHKATQTPRRVPYDDETSYPSKKAELGKQLYEILIQGHCIPDDLLMENLIEYLRENTTDDGWVLVNFPYTYEQADLIEEALTGKKIPHASRNNGIFNETPEYIQTVNKDFLDIKSALLPNPFVEPKPEPFRTYFTIYINMKKTEEESDQLQVVLNSEVVPLEKFYRCLGIGYTFYYKTLDFDTIKHLAKIVIGDWGLSLKTSEELFGPVLEDFETLNSANKSEKNIKKIQGKDSNKTEQKILAIQMPNMVKKQSNSNKMKFPQKDKENPNSSEGKVKPDKDKIRKLDVKTITKSAQVNNEENCSTSIIDNENNQINAKTVEKHEDFIQTLQEGHLEYSQETRSFVELNIPAEIQITLATTWEGMEKVYKETIKQAFFLIRIHRNTIVPYEKFIRDYFNKFIKRPDEKQPIVISLQSMFNEIDEDLRAFADMKSELHCRVTELESKLLNMCDDRKRMAELERVKVTKQDWVAGEMTALGDAFVVAAQAEADRAIDTLQLLVEYYLAMLCRPPHYPPLQKERLPRLVEPFDDSRVSMHSSSAPGPSDAASQPHYSRSERSEDIRGSAEITRWLLDTLAVTDPPAYPRDSFSATIDTTINKLEESASMVHDIMSREKNEINQKMGTNKKKKFKKSAKEEEIQVVDDEATMAIFQTGSQLFEEWEEATASEIKRATFRLKLLKSRACKDLTELIIGMRNMFRDIHEEISGRYKREVGAIEALCTVLRVAIEEEMPIQQQLLLEGDRFFARHDALMFPFPPPPEAPHADEPSTSVTFRIDQLQWLTKTFRNMSPKGVMPERAFTFVLDDLVAHGTEGEMPRVLPSRWELLRQHHIYALVDKIFGTVVYVDWRDFLVHALGLRAPSQVELLSCKNQFQALDQDSSEAVTWSDFCEVQFWFEDDFPIDSPDLHIRLRKIKQLLFSIFEIRKDLTSYTDMLLAFCKDDNPKEGLAKALALTINKIVSSHKPDSDMLHRGVTEAQISSMVYDENARVAVEDMVTTILKEGETEIMNVKSGYVAVQDIVSDVLITVIPSENGVDRKQYEYAEELPLQLVATVLAATLLWGAEIPPLFCREQVTLWEGLTAMYRKLEAENNCVSPWDFMQHKFVDDLLACVRKFNTVDLDSVLEEVLAMNVDAAESYCS